MTSPKLNTAPHRLAAVCFALLFCMCADGPLYLEQTALGITSPQQLTVYFSESIQEYDASSWFSVIRQAPAPSVVDTVTDHALTTGGRGIQLNLTDTLQVGGQYVLDYLLNCRIDGISSATTSVESSKVSGRRAVAFTVTLADSVLTAVTD